MKILVIGSGGREHALVWKLSQSPRVKKIYCAPGNGGISDQAECVTIAPENISGLLEFAKKNQIDLTVVGPELPLSLGIVDEFEKHGQKIFGPQKNASILESSKCFTKEFCTRNHIPTASYTFYYKAADAKAVLKEHTKFPVVIKADGLAQGKGVVIAKNKEEAMKAVDQMMVHERFGDAGRKIVIEEFMEGQEATFMIATDGKDYVCLESSQDHKPIGEGDSGPNTGGMGAYSPAPLVNKEVHQKVMEQIIKPLLNGMRQEDRLYRGILYAGLMIADGNPRLVEFNCRFGDPEAQAILYRMESDLVDLIEAVLENRLATYKIKFIEQPAVCVVMSSEGYPGDYSNGKLIKGLDEVSLMENTFVFHAGTKKDSSGCLTSGGRVLGVTAQGKNLKDAIKNVYSAVEKISWEGAYYRRDIGTKGL